MVSGPFWAGQVQVRTRQVQVRTREVQVRTRRLLARTDHASRNPGMQGAHARARARARVHAGDQKNVTF